MNNKYSVIVGNIGTVYDGHNSKEANKAFAEYMRQSKANYGRVSGESVTLFKNDEIEKEYLGTNDLV